MFLTDQDYAVVIGDDALRTISRASEQNRANAEQEAIEEISGYLRPVYDCNNIFSAEGSERNPLIVMRTADIALYHLFASMPQKMGAEIRKERYDRAVEWLEHIQSGKIVPDLPRAIDPEADGFSCPTVFFADKPLRHNW